MSDETKNKSRVALDVGVSAKVEVKTEIPKEDTGRLVAALTDVIRPFTESRGLRADQIRLQREDVLIEIAKKARLRADLERLDLRPVPPKMLVPFMEKASLEGPDQEMQDRWAALLLSASTAYQAQHLTFVDILSRLTSYELKLLERVCFSYDRFPETSYPGGHIEENRDRIRAHANKLLVSDLTPENQLEARDSFNKAVNLLAYGRIMHLTVGTGSGASVYLYSEYGSPGSHPFASLEILEREGLVDFERFELSGSGVQVAWFNVTFLGIKIVRECSPDALAMATRPRGSTEQSA